jgi:hypothetical protein
MGLPGSGKKTFVAELEKYYSVDFYCDFYDGKLNTHTKSDIIAYTNFSNFSNWAISRIDITKEKLVTIIFPKIYEKTQDERYSEFFGVDINLLYECDIFPRVNSKIVGNFGAITYTNFQDCKKIIDEVMNNTENMTTLITSMVQSKLPEADLSKMETS